MEIRSQRKKSEGFAGSVSRGGAEGWKSQFFLDFRARIAEGGWYDHARMNAD